MEILKRIKQKFCGHEQVVKAKILKYYPPSINEARGEYFEYDGYKCTKCGKLFI